MSTVFITGASRGIGRATAVEFANRDWRVVATARDPRDLADLDVAERLALDVTDQSSVDAAIAAAGPIDALVSNAGVIFLAAVEATPISELERLFALNTAGAMRVTQAVLPQMRARGTGRLLYLSSVVGRIVLPGNSAYAASKWALEALVESLATELAPLGIAATLLEPGAVDSGALDTPTTYRLPDDPYPQVLASKDDPALRLSPAAVATAIADTAERADPPLRVPIGDRAEALLAARRGAPDDVPFLARR